jgi:tetratricopeptide (TPR) repeat protein
MTDLSGILDQRMNDRIISALNELDFEEFQTLMANLLDKIGVKLTDRKTEGDAVQFRGESEEARYLVLASRLFDHASLSNMKRLRTTARAEGRNPVLMITNDLDAEVRKYAEAEGVSFADKQKLLLLLRKYELADPIVERLDQRILESQGNRSLPSASRYDNHMAKAIEHMDMARYEEALYDLDRALEIKPNHDEVWRLRASALYQLGRLEEATESCQRCIELRPTDQNAWLLLGLIRGQADDLEGELRSYDNVLRLDPGNRSALLNRGTALYKAKRLEQALKSFDQLIKMDNSDSMAWNNRGIVLKAMGRRRDALDAFTRAATLDRDYVNPLINLGIIHTEDAQPDRAVQDWKMVLQLQRRRPEIWYSLGEALSELGEWEDAKVAFESALQYDPGLEEARRRIEEIDAILSPPQGAPVPVPVPVPVEPPCPIPEPEIETEIPCEVEAEAVEVPEATHQPIETLSEEAHITIEEVPCEPVPPPVCEEPPVETHIDERLEPQVDEAPVPLERSLVSEPDMDIEVPPPSHLELTVTEEKGICLPPKETALLPIKELAPEVIPVPVQETRSEGERPTLRVSTEEVCQPAPDLEPAPAEEICESAPDILSAALATAAVEIEAAQVPAAPTVEEVQGPASSVPDMEDRIDLSVRRRLSAKMLLLVGEGDKALMEVDRALQEEPEADDLMLMRAQALMGLGRNDEALTALGASYQIARSPDTLYDVEALSQRFGRKLEAQRLQSMLPPSQESFARELADLLERREYDQIISRHAQAGDRSSVRSRQCLALACMMRRRYRDASKVWQDLLTQFPGWAEALNNLGVCMRFMGEFGYEEPLRHMMLATMVEPDYADAWNNIGCVYFAAGAYSEALKAFGSAVTIDRNPEYYLNLSSAQMAIGEVAGAKQSLTSALQLEETPEVLYMLGVIAEKEGDLRWASSLYEDAIALKPDFRDALFNLQRVKLQLKYSK